MVTPLFCCKPRLSSLFNKDFTITVCDVLVVFVNILKFWLSYVLLSPLCYPSARALYSCKVLPEVFAKIQDIKAKKAWGGVRAPTSFVNIEI